MQAGITLRWSFRSIAPALCAEGTNLADLTQCHSLGSFHNAFTPDGFRRLRRSAILSAWEQALADARQCKGFHKGEKCSKFITDYESKPDENGDFKLKEVILGIQERKVEPKESALLMKQYSKEIYDIVIKPIEKYVYSENGLSTKSTDARNGLKPFPTTKTTVDTGHIESAVTLPHLQDKKYTTTTNIIICPDAALFTIPFAALITDNNNYLAEKYSISLIQSATAWMKLQREEKREYTQTLFAMGNSVYGMGHSNTKGITGQRGLSISPSTDSSSPILPN